MSSLVGVTTKSTANPYAINKSARTGDEFLMWNMGSINYVEPPTDMDVLYGLSNHYNMGQISQLFSAAQSAFGGMVASIEFRSQISPPIVVNQPFAQGQGGAPPQAQVQGGSPFTAAFMSEAKPAVYIHLTDGTVYPIEPYGTPVDDYYTPYILAGVGVTLALGAIIGIKIGQRMFCAKPVAAKS